MKTREALRRCPLTPSVKGRRCGGSSEPSCWPGSNPHPMATRLVCGELREYSVPEGSVLKEPRKGTSNVWVLRYYKYKDGKRKYRRQIIGTVTELPLKHDAEKAAAVFRSNINARLECRRQSRNS